MPEIIAPIIGFLATNAPAIGAASALATAGTTIGQAVAGAGGGGVPSPAAAPAPTPPSSSDLSKTRAAIAQQYPNVISETSGLASPGYSSLISQLLSGTLGTPGSTLAGEQVSGQFKPITNSPSPIPSETNPNLSDFINSFVTAGA